MADNGKKEYAVYYTIRNARGSCARLGLPWATYELALASEAARLPGALIVSGDRANLRAQLSMEEARRREVVGRAN